MKSNNKELKPLLELIYFIKVLKLFNVEPEKANNYILERLESIYKSYER